MKKKFNVKELSFTIVLLIFTTLVFFSCVEPNSVDTTNSKTEFTVTLEDYDPENKIPVIKAVREVTGLGLAESKGLVERAPIVIKEKISKEEADRISNILKEAGAIITIK